MEISAVDLAWLAGFLEGEGSFMGGRQSGTLASGAPKTSVRIRVTAPSTDFDVLYRVQSIAGGEIYGPTQREACKPLYQWALVRRARAVELMELLRPHMGARRVEQIDAALEVHRSVPARIMGRRHGTNSRYSVGCRCAPCRDAHRIYMRDYKARRVAA